MFSKAFFFKEKNESTVLVSSSRLKCLSINEAPRATDVIGVAKLSEWSDIPTNVLNFFLIAGKVIRFCSSIGAGYEDTHCKIIIFLHPFSFNVLIAKFRSFKSAKPIDNITGFFVFATLINKGI